MNSYLLDTHIFLWAYMKPEKIGKSISRILENPNAVRYLSAISLIEIVRLYETKPKDFDLNIPLSTFLSQVLTQLQVQTLAITPEHAQRYYEIQPIGDHKDPFDYLPLLSKLRTQKYPKVSLPVRGRIVLQQIRGAYAHAKRYQVEVGVVKDEFSPYRIVGRLAV